MAPGQVAGAAKRLQGIMGKALKEKGMRLPGLVIAFARRRGRHYVCPRSSAHGGSSMSSRLTAMDIENQDFSRKMRGYDPEEVDLFLKSVSENVERLTLENGEMLEELGHLRKQLEELRAHERTLQETLVSAQRMGEEMKDRAGREGELVVQEARHRADRMHAEAQNSLMRLEADISRAKLDRETFERQLRSVIEQHLTLLDLRRDARSKVDNLRVLPNRLGSETG
jgi:cell division initiation protein